jgi:hypothetical protein
MIKGRTLGAGIKRKFFSAGVRMPQNVPKALPALRIGEGRTAHIIGNETVPKGR